MGRDALDILETVAFTAAIISLGVFILYKAQQPEPQVEVRYVITTCPAEERVDF